jgi:hypothetical protein
MQTPEHRIAVALTHEAKARGLFIRKCRWEGRLGCPDYLIIRNGKVIFVETKAPGESPRKSQLAEFAKIQEYGGVVYVVDTPGKVSEIMEEICGKY